LTKKFVFKEDEKGPLKVASTFRRNHPSDAGSTGVLETGLPSLLDHQSERQYRGGLIHDELDYYMTRLQEEIGLF
jgi:hypothetical protein